MLQNLYLRLRDESRLPRLLFYGGLLVELLIVIVDKSNYTNPIEGQLFRLTFLLFAGKLFLTKRSFREWALVAALMAVGFLSWRITGENDIIRIVTFVAACKGIPLRTALKYFFYVTLVGCLVIVALAVTGIYGDMTLTQAFGREDMESTILVGKEMAETTRYTLGMGHPNALACMAFMVTAMGVFLFHERLKWQGCLLVALPNVGVCLLADSKTGLLITLAFLGAALCLTCFPRLREKEAIYVCGLLVFVLCVGFSVDAAVCAEQMRVARVNAHYLGVLNEDIHITVLDKLDRALNGRIFSLTNTERNDGMIQTWSAFSCKENTRYYFDMGWVKLFYRYGVIPGCIYLAASLLLLWKLWKMRDGFGLALFVAFAVYTVVEAHLISPYIGRNCLLLMMGALPFPPKNAMLDAGKRWGERFLGQA